MAKHQKSHSSPAGNNHVPETCLLREPFPSSFKTGKTFKELLQEKRLTQAAYFLKHTSLHVDEIGEAVGYSNLSYFHRIFQEKYGMTPKKYRNE